MSRFFVAGLSAMLVSESLATYGPTDLHCEHYVDQDCQWVWRQRTCTSRRRGATYSCRKLVRECTVIDQWVQLVCRNWGGVLSGCDTACRPEGDSCSVRVSESDKLKNSTNDFYEYHYTGEDDEFDDLAAAMQYCEEVVSYKNCQCGIPQEEDEDDSNGKGGKGKKGKGKGDSCYLPYSGKKGGKKGGKNGRRSLNIAETTKPLKTQSFAPIVVGVALAVLTVAIAVGAAVWRRSASTVDASADIDVVNEADL